jgi:hypothetical protein
VVFKLFRLKQELREFMVNVEFLKVPKKAM